MNAVPTADVLQTLSPKELFNVLPTTIMLTAPLTGPDQLPRWEALNGDHREAQEILSVPGLRSGTTYWVQDPLHALVLRQAAWRGQHAAEVLWDLAVQQYAVLVADTMANAWQ